MRRRGFTLIELLVVVAIVAALAAILFPVFARARERARVVHCMNNLKQLGTAMPQYLQDWDDRFPHAWGAFWVVKGYRPSIRQCMEAYVPDERVWQCPSDIGELFLYTWDSYQMKTPPFYSDSWGATSYSYMGQGHQRSQGRIGGLPVSVVLDSSRVVFLVETRPWHGGYDPNMRGMASTSPALVNVLYCDGHVARRTWAQWTTDTDGGVKQ